MSRFPVWLEEIGMETQLESREQSVSLLELFYDLVYVYAISQVTGIIHSPSYRSNRWSTIWSTRS